VEKMIIHHDIFIAEGRLIVAEITENTDQLFSYFKQDELECVVVSEKHSEKRKREFLGTRLILKQIANTVEVCYTQSGKPFPKNGTFHLSISHSANYIAVFTHPTREVGVDIELNTQKIDAVYKRFLSEKEQGYLYDPLDRRKIQIAWSAKEALYKIIGHEAVDFSNELEVENFEIAVQGDITAKHISTNNTFDLRYFQSAIYTMVYCIA
jgi:4'-phosphopantetheinyl transferase